MEFEVPFVVSDISIRYPFGMGMPTRSYSSNIGIDYRFAFNGQEYENSIIDNKNIYDFSFRLFDVRIGRLLAVDPLTKEYPWYTPYQFAGNKPTKFVDKLGLQEAELQFGDPAILALGRGIMGKSMEPEKIGMMEEILTIGELKAMPLALSATSLGFGLSYGFSFGTLAWSGFNTIVRNSVTTTEVAVAIVSVLTGYDGPDPSASFGDDLAEIGQKGYAKLVIDKYTEYEIAVVSRAAYNKVVNTIDEAIEEIPGLRQKALKAYEIRNDAKIFARELSGPTNKAAAEARNLKKYGNPEGPTFNDLFNSYISKGMSEDEAYNAIIESSKRTDPMTNTIYQSEK